MKNTLLACLLLVAACAAHADDLGKPRLLVAVPEMQGLYSHTALIAVPVNDEHVGFILNRATALKLGTVFPEHAPSAKVVDPLYFGGPEMAGSIFAIVRGNPGEPSLPLFDGLFATASAQAVDRIIEQTPNDARYYAGFVGWRAGELAKEIAAGYWIVADPSAAVVFSKDTDEALWKQLVEFLRLGRI
jgi:putative transcriptional regulator